MTEQEQDALEQAAKPQRWGSKERVALVAEVLRQRRVIEWLASTLANASACVHMRISVSEWIHIAEQAVAEEISPEEQV